jgi:hypothetical protein
MGCIFPFTVLCHYLFGYGAYLYTVSYCLLPPRISRPTMGFIANSVFKLDPTKDRLCPAVLPLLYAAVVSPARLW